MMRFRHAWCAALMFAAIAPAQAVPPVIEGNMTVSYVTGGSVEQVLGIVKIQTRDGKATGELVADSPRIKNITLKSVAQEGQTLRIVLTNGAVDLTFEGALPKDNSNRVLGTLSIDATLYPAWLAKTELTTLDLKSSSRAVACPPMQQARALATKAQTLRFRALQSKDPEQKKDLLKQAVDADALARAEAPKLYREVLEKFQDSPAVFDAALELVRRAQASEARPADVKAWATTAAAAAKAYGARWQGEVNAQLASAMLTQEGLAATALDFARQAEKALTPASPPAQQSRVLTLLAKALHQTGKADEAKALDARLSKIEAELDREYLAKMPPFKGSPFTGRKGKSDRAVFMELFTGAACPPCVAADLAFDVLQKTYKPTELVLIQYHVHIPGPDPMTNPDTEARWKYYSQAFPMQVRGVPSSIFNGQPAAGGGGGVANAEKKYEAYREVIEPLLEERSLAKITAVAHRKGDRIDINVDVTDLAGADPQKKLRILLAEETIRYVGSNKIRFHHNVVRAMPGGVQGKSLTAAASKHKASIDLGELRGSLTKYLSNYEASGRPFANPARPLDLNNLRVIAFVQDDSTKQVLQAVQVEVENGK